VSKLLADPRASLGKDKRFHELTVIFAEDDEDDPPRKRQKRNPDTENSMVDEELTKEEKLKRLFTKLANEPEVQIIEQQYPPAHIPGANTSGNVFLEDLIETNGSSCLNESRQHKWQSILLNDGSYLESDCDEQLILNLRFRKMVRIHSLKIKAPNIAAAPHTVKLFTNQAYMDFNNIHDIPPSQILKLAPKNFFESSQIITLNTVKFSKVNSISIFIEDNQGGEKYTIVEQIQFIGKPL